MNNFQKASFFERLLALLVDGIILFIIQMILKTLFSNIYLQTPFLPFVIAALYGIIFLTISGATPGKRLIKIRVVHDSYTKLALGNVILRETVGKYISSLIFSLGYFWVLIDPRKQAWHDKIAQSVVVKTDSNGKLIPIPADVPVTRRERVLFAIFYLLFGLPVFAVALFAFVYLFLFRPLQVSGLAMSPNYIDREYVLTRIVNTHIYSPKRGDVIIVHSPTDPEKDFIKRVIGLPGESVMVQNGDIYINNQKLDESKYISQSVKTYAGAFLHEGQPVIVPQDMYFVLGDNRSNSSDSREWGFLKKNAIVSTALFCYFGCPK